jgi:2-oxoisovalerate dehydrogenase E2 component (dihydrolipoyl transacylase)
MHRDAVPMAATILPVQTWKRRFIHSYHRRPKNDDSDRWFTTNTHPYVNNKETTTTMTTIPFVLADIGEGIKEVEILQWYVRPGDVVQQFDRICEVQSDKATVEITSRYDGTIASLGPQDYTDSTASLDNTHHHDLGNYNVPGCIIQVGQPLLYLYASHHTGSNSSSSRTNVASTITKAAATTTTTPVTAEAAAVPTRMVSSSSIANQHSDHPSARLSIPTIASQYHLPSDNHHHDDDDDTSSDGILAASPDGQDSNSSSSVVVARGGNHTVAHGGASPAVRRLGREYGIDHVIGTIRGTGPNQRVLKSDVMTYLKERNLWKELPPVLNDPLMVTTDVVAPQQGQHLPGISSFTQVTPQQGPPPPPPTAQLPHRHPNDTIRSLRGYSRQMAKTMTAALQIPHMCLGDEICMNELLILREQLNHMKNNINANTNSVVTNPTTSTTSTTLEHPEQQPVKMSILAILVKAVSCALSDYPIMNSTQYHDNEVVDASSPKTTTTASSSTTLQFIQRYDQNIGIAMDTPRGLVVPVLRQCQQLSMIEIQQQLNTLKRLAVTNQLQQLEHLSDVTFTVSNIGSMGVGSFMQPVLAPPALAMGAFGRIRTVPRFRPHPPTATGSDDRYNTSSHNKNSNSSTIPDIYAAHVMSVTWAGDHRFLDGATLGRFHGRFAHYVEHPITMLSRLK